MWVTDACVFLCSRFVNKKDATILARDTITDIYGGVVETFSGEESALSAPCFCYPY